MLDILVWVGSILLALCGLPLALEAIRRKCDYTPLTFLLMWYIGEWFCAIYAVSISELALTFNYVFNIICISIVLYYNLRSRTK